MKKKQMERKDMYAKRAELEQLVLQCFDFLVHEQGFDLNSSERSIWATYHVYRRKPLGLEIGLDFRDTDIRVYVVKLQQGNIPENGYEINGERVRMPLLYMLRVMLNIQDERIESLYTFLTTEHVREYQFAILALKQYEAILRSYTDVLLHQSLEQLFPPIDIPLLSKYLISF